MASELAGDYYICEQCGKKPVPYMVAIPTEHAGEYCWGPQAHEIDTLRLLLRVNAECYEIINDGRRESGARVVIDGDKGFHDLSEYEEAVLKRALEGVE